MADAADPLVEAATLLQECGLVPREDLARIRVTGADRVDYLHRMLTQDIAGLAVGAATYACLLTVKGRILGDMLVWHLDDHLLLEMPAGARAGVMGVLERYVIADDVAFAEETPVERHALIGPAAEACLRSARIAPPAAGQACWAGPVDGVVRILRFDRRGLPIFEIAGDVARIEVPVLGSRAYEIARVHHDIPAFGAELGEDVLFNEAGLEEAISWTKGCFPGQEPVVMAKHRGHPPRHLVKIGFDAEPPPPGAQLFLDGQAVGHVTSSAPAIQRWEAAALAYVKHALAEPGAVFTLEDGTTALVRSVSGPVAADGGSA